MVDGPRPSFSSHWPSTDQPKPVLYGKTREEYWRGGGGHGKGTQPNQEKGRPREEREGGRNTSSALFKSVRPLALFLARQADASSPPSLLPFMAVPTKLTKRWRHVEKKGREGGRSEKAFLFLDWALFPPSFSLLSQGSFFFFLLRHFWIFFLSLFSRR